MSQPIPANYDWQALLAQLVEQMTLTNQFLAQVVAHNADMLDAGGEAEEAGPETLTNTPGRVGSRTYQRGMGDELHPPNRIGSVGKT